VSGLGSKDGKGAQQGVQPQDGLDYVCRTSIECDEMTEMKMLSLNWTLGAEGLGDGDAERRR